MIIKKYSDLKRIDNDMIVDLHNLGSKQYMMAICLLAGLTYRVGSLTKIEKNKFLVELEE